MSRFYTIFLIIFSSCLYAQEKSETQKFWEKLEAHCGKAYEGTLSPEVTDAGYVGKTLKIFIRTCEDNRITIPFYVGEDRSRTFILTKEGDRLKFKHDHRHEDGSEDEITQYGGTSTNSGTARVQVFPADVETAQLIPAAATNVWWLEMDDKTLSYNLKRLGKEGPAFKVTFDLTKPVATPEAPWGWD